MDNEQETDEYDAVWNLTYREGTPFITDRTLHKIKTVDRRSDAGNPVEVTTACGLQYRYLSRRLTTVEEAPESHRCGNCWRDR